MSTMQNWINSISSDNIEMEKTYHFRVADSIEQQEHMSIKTIDGRYFHLPHQLFKQLDAIQNDPSSCFSSLPDYTLDALIGKGILLSDDNIPKDQSRKSFVWTHPLLTGDQLLSLCKAFSAFFKIKKFLCFTLFTISMLYLNWSDYGQIFNVERINIATKNLGSDVLLLLLFYILTSGFIHELGHMTSLYRFLGKVTEIGVSVNYIVPSFYADIGSAVLLRDKHDRIIISASGIYFQILTFPWLVLPFILTENIDYFILLTLMLVLQVSFNLFPFGRNDGYWIYRDFFEISSNSNSLPALILKMLFIPGALYFGYVIFLAAHDLYSNIYINHISIFNQKAFEIFRQVLSFTYISLGMKVLYQKIKKS